MLANQFSGVIRTQRQWRDSSGTMRAEEIEQTTHGDPVLAGAIDEHRIDEAAIKNEIAAMTPRPPRRVLKYPWLRWLYNAITREVS